RPERADQARVREAMTVGAALVLLLQASLPHPPGARVVDVSPPAARGNEPSIAVNPRDPAQIVGVYQGPARAVYSTDSGRTFTTAPGTVPSDWRSAGDVSVTFDDKGSAYLSYLVFDRL